MCIRTTINCYGEVLSQAHQLWHLSLLTPRSCDLRDFLLSLGGGGMYCGLLRLPNHFMPNNTSPYTTSFPLFEEVYPAVTGHSGNFTSRRTRNQKFTQGFTCIRHLFVSKDSKFKMLDQGWVMSRSLLWRWVKPEATFLESWDMFFLNHPALAPHYWKFLKVLLYLEAPKRDRRPKPYNTESEQKSSRKKKSGEKEEDETVSVGFLSENTLSKKCKIFPLALGIISPLSIKQSFNIEVVPDASTHRSAFSTIGD